MSTKSAKWDAARKAAGEADEGGIFLSLKDDKDMAMVVFRGEPEIEKVVWNGESYDPYDPKKHTDKKPSTKMKINVFDIKANQMKIFKMSYQTFIVLDKVLTKKGFDCVYEIERQGAKNDTKTVYTIIHEEDMSADLKKKVKKEKLLDLNLDEESSGSNGEASLESIKAKLKEMDKDAIQSFLKKFGVKKINQLEEDQFPKAMAFIGEMRGEDGSDDENVDPFAE